jgi:hypothetical protein
LGAVVKMGFVTAYRSGCHMSLFSTPCNATL